MKPVIIDNKEWTIKEMKKATGLSRRGIHYRLTVLKKEGKPLNKLFDHKFWEKRASDKWLARLETPWGRLTYDEIAERLGLTKPQVKGRVRVCRREKLDFALLADDEFWASRRGYHGPKTKKQKPARIFKIRKPTVTKKKIDRLAEETLDKIPGPSAVERRMEKIGLL